MTGHSDSTDPPGPPIVSVIIPTLNEAELLPGLLADLVLVEIIVSDGGSLDETAALARTGGARVVHARQGRGPQLNAGAGEGAIACGTADGAAAEQPVLTLHSNCVLSFVTEVGNDPYGVAIVER
jgi:cellulose synthase/poly-beta-1,6-N-acetylglucosamine synthase-like glycosyltransferase